MVEEFEELLSNEELSGNEDGSEPEVENRPDTPTKKNRKRVRKKAWSECSVLLLWYNIVTPDILYK